MKYYLNKFLRVLFLHMSRFYFDSRALKEFQVIDEQIVILVLSVGKRERSGVYQTAQQRL